LSLIAALRKTRPSDVVADAKFTNIALRDRLTCWLLLQRI
jgi:hypothetical protein